MADPNANRLGSTPTDRLRGIAAEGSFLWERLAFSTCECDAPEASRGKVDARIERWARLVAGGDVEKLARRLEWDGLSLERTKPWLGGVRWRNAVGVPAWVCRLAGLVDAARQLDGAGLNPSPLDPADPFPFEDVLLPIVAAARRRLMDNYGLLEFSETRAPFRVLSASAYRSLERALLAALWPMFVDALHYEFLQTRHFGQSLLRTLGAAAKTTGSRHRYLEFVRRMTADGLIGIFHEYPVLARLTTVAVDLWVAATAEFLDRLNADQMLIGEHFRGQSKGIGTIGCLGRVNAIHASLSDRHNRGRSVCKLTFESGMQIVYKPKSLSIENAFNRLIAWYNDHSSALPLKTVAVLDRGDYGWVEFVSQLPCATAREAGSYYERAGMLLCWVYALRGNDCHNENVIACGEHPVLIDLETLFHHDPRNVDDGHGSGEGETTALSRFSDSVLRTGMIPRWVIHPVFDISYDVSGLATDDSFVIRMAWCATNTDDMHWASVDPVIVRERNVPILDGKPLSPSVYQDRIRKGFETAYRFIMAQREALLAPDGPLAPFRGQIVRHVFRPTRIYGQIHELTWNRECLRSGAEYSIALDRLALAFLGGSQRPEAWPVLGAEVRAMERLDIPVFLGNTGTDALYGEEMTPVPRHFKQPSYGQVLAHISSFGEADLEFQLAIIADSLYGLVARSVVLPADAGSGGAAAEASSEDLLGAAVAIGDELERRALREPDGGASWMGMAYIFRVSRFQLEMLGDNLYDGRGGIAVFLAALHEATGSEKYRDLALRALHPLRKLISSASPQTQRLYSRTMGLGGAAGLGSVIYVLVKLAGLLGDRKLLQDAGRLARWINSELVAADSEFDVIGGSAGAILGLLTLFDASGDSAVLDTAHLCGEHLLNRRVPTESGFGVWRSMPDRPPLTGLSHGAAGIAYALVRLYARSGNARYLDAALAGIDYERSLFRARANNWPDLRGEEQGDEALPVQWCHGAPGIALARLRCLELVDIPGAIAEVDAALETTQAHAFGRLDHLCCGNLGRAEVLLYAARRLRRPKLERSAYSIAGQVLERSRSDGGYSLFANLPVSVFHPGFFQGTAGIGYQFLRMSGQRLPSVVAWE